MCTRSAHAAVSKVSADAVLKMALNEKKQGTFILILLTYIFIITRLGINAPTGLLCNTLSNRCLERTLGGTAELEHLISPGSS